MEGFMPYESLEVVLDDHLAGVTATHQAAAATA
jgi:hypothetical protein